MSISREQEIYDISANLFRDRGYHATSMQDIADAVGLQKGSLYHYISSKEDLLARIAEEALTTFNDGIEGIYQRDLSPTEKLRRALEHHVVSVAERLDLMSVYLQESRALTSKQQTEMLEQRARYENLVQKILQDGIAAGEFREVDVKIVANALLGMCNWVYQWYRSDGRLSPQEIAAVFVDIVLKGLAKQ